MITQDRLKEILHYNPNTGIFTWLKRKQTDFKTLASLNSFNNKHAGKIAGTLDTDGYVLIRIFSKSYKAHRLAWLYIYGEFPENGIDHENHIKNDNRIYELRPANALKNARNRLLNKNNTTGVSGVCWRKYINKWEARISVKGKYIHLGSFTDKKDAIAARKGAEVNFDFHPNHGTKQRVLYAK